MDQSQERAFADFVDGVSPRLLTLAWYLTGSAHEAQDLVQETLERVYLRWTRLSDIESAPSYARRVLTNLRTDKWRARRREVLVATAPTDAAVSGHAEEAAGRVDLASALQTLPQRERTIVVLRYYADESERSVAQMLGVTTGTVKTAAHRGLAKLRLALAEGDEDHVRR